MRFIKFNAKEYCCFFVDADTQQKLIVPIAKPATMQFTKCNEHFIRNIFSNLAARTTHKLELNGKPVGSASARARTHAQSVDAQPENITPPNPFYWIVGGVKTGKKYKREEQNIT